MGAPHVFTLEAVNALVPRLRVLVGAQLGRRVQIEHGLEQLAGKLGGLPDEIQVESSDAPEVADLKSDLLERMEAYRAAWAEIEDLGAVLKDPRVGLLDFYGHVDGKLVWLCWRYDEDSVNHYHALDEGFAARKPIETTMRHRHLH